LKRGILALKWLEAKLRADATRAQDSGSLWLDARNVVGLSSRLAETDGALLDDGFGILLITGQDIAMLAEWSADPEVSAAGYAEPLRQLRDFLARDRRLPPSEDM
jgi:hypothetical protein